MFRPAFAIFAQQYLSVLLGDLGTVYLNEPIPRNSKLRIYKHPSRLNWGTEYLSAVTAGNNRVMVSPEVIGEAEMVDVLFEPNPKKSQTSLGLLGELTLSPCIIEIFRWAPNQWDLETSLRHWLTWKAESNGSIIPINENSSDTDSFNSDTAQDSQSDRSLDEDKNLLIIVPSIAPEHLKGFGGKPSGNISGVYQFPRAFCTTVIVTRELPQNPSTLWLRILGRGATQRAAILELNTLDVNHPHCAVVRQQLRQWYQLLSQGQNVKESIRLMETLAMINNLN
jgi:hypothetical protein